MNNILEVRDLGKEYPLPQGTLSVFQGLDFELEKGALIAIMGVSGVGKTTLLNLFGLLDKPSKGEIFLDGKPVLVMGDKEKAGVRNRKIGFIFQFYHLLPEFTAEENVSFPLLMRGIKKKNALQQASAMLEEVSLKDKASLRPSRLSGGEQQRLAIARALINHPNLLLADEPTGNLDWETGKMILKLIERLHMSKGLSSIIVTHNEKVAEFCQKTYLMEAGELKLLSSR